MAFIITNPNNIQLIPIQHQSQNNNISYLVPVTHINNINQIQQCPNINMVTNNVPSQRLINTNMNTNINNNNTNTLTLEQLQIISSIQQRHHLEIPMTPKMAPQQSQQQQFSLVIPQNVNVNSNINTPNTPILSPQTPQTPIAFNNNPYNSINNSSVNNQPKIFNFNRNQSSIRNMNQPQYAVGMTNNRNISNIQQNVSFQELFNQQNNCSSTINSLGFNFYFQIFSVP